MRERFEHIRVPVNWDLNRWDIGRATTRPDAIEAVLGMPVIADERMPESCIAFVGPNDPNFPPGHPQVTILTLGPLTPAEKRRVERIFDWSFPGIKAEEAEP